MQLGWSLDDLTHAYSWRDLAVLMRRWRVTPGSAYGEATAGHPIWTLDQQILADIVDSLNSANWQRGGRAHAPKPKKYKRPWLKQPGHSFGSKPIPMSKFHDWWDGPKRGSQE